MWLREDRRMSRGHEKTEWRESYQHRAAGFFQNNPIMQNLVLIFHKGHGGSCESNKAACVMRFGCAGPALVGPNWHIMAQQVCRTANSRPPGHQRSPIPSQNPLRLLFHFPNRPYNTCSLQFDVVTLVPGDYNSEWRPGTQSLELRCVLCGMGAAAVAAWEVISGGGEQ